MLATNFSTEPALVLLQKIRELVGVAFDDRLSINERYTLQKELYGIKEEIVYVRPSVEPIEKFDVAKTLSEDSTTKIQKNKRKSFLAQANQNSERIALLLSE